MWTLEMAESICTKLVNSWVLLEFGDPFRDGDWTSIQFAWRRALSFCAHIFPKGHTYLLEQCVALFSTNDCRYHVKQTREDDVLVFSKFRGSSYSNTRMLKLVSVTVFVLLYINAWSQIPHCSRNTILCLRVWPLSVRNQITVTKWRSQGSDWATGWTVRDFESW